MNRKRMNLRMFENDVAIIDRTGADTLIPEERAREIIQGVVTQSAVLSQGRRLPNMSSRTYRMPVLDMLPLAYFVNEYDIWAEVRPRVEEAFGKVIDGAILFDENKPDSWRDGIVTTATKATSVVTLGASDDLYDKIMGKDGVIAKVEESGFFVTGHMADISMRAKLRGLKDSTGNPIFKSDMQNGTRYSLDGSTMNFPNNGAFDKSKALMISGDFSQLVYSIRQDITFKLFTEGIVQNTDGTIAYNLMQQDMVALRAVMRIGWEIPNPINSLKTDKSKRCPFAIMKSGS